MRYKHAKNKVNNDNTNKLHNNNSQACLSFTNA